MADHFANGFWDGDYWVESYFGTDVAGSMVAGLSGSGSLSATISIAATETKRGGDDGGYVRQRRKYKYVTAQKLQELLDAEEARKAPEPTHKRLRAVKREIVANIEAAGLLGPVKPAVARLVQQELVREYVPDMDWRALANAVADIMRKAAEEAARLEQEIEDEDEDFLILMAA